MSGYAVHLDQLDAARWQWLLDFTLAGLAFEHSFDLLLGPDAAASLAAENPDATRWRKQLDALRHHGLGQALTLLPGAPPPSGYRHVFRF